MKFTIQDELVEGGSINWWTAVALLRCSIILWLIFFFFINSLKWTISCSVEVFMILYTENPVVCVCVCAWDNVCECSCVREIMCERECVWGKPSQSALIHLLWMDTLHISVLFTTELSRQFTWLIFSSRTWCFSLLTYMPRESVSCFFLL